ncbi:putative 2OG-Fe(II) oxygenase [Nisaea sp.]|uniref:putative 2OG-Fe(II) oxygenase n=1 Tax=Nisaea sp. TaxID=2024842 RepID=UPI003B51D8B1
MQGYDRENFARLIFDKQYEQAMELAKNSHKETEPFSSENLYSLVDAHALWRSLYPNDRSWDAIFSSQYIKHYRYGKIGGFRIDEINKKLTELCQEIGYTENPREHLDIAGENKLIITDQDIPTDLPEIIALKATASEIYEDYVSTILRLGYPRYRVREIARQRLFAAATRSDGFHPPHLHSNATFVMTYYFQVPAESRTKLQFGKHNLIQSTPFHEVVPETGDFFIFPSCYMHGTTKAETKALRANLGFEFEPVPQS